MQAVVCWYNIAAHVAHSAPEWTLVFQKPSNGLFAETTSRLERQLDDLRRGGQPGPVELSPQARPQVYGGTSDCSGANLSSLFPVDDLAEGIMRVDRSMREQTRAIEQPVPTLCATVEVKMKGACLYNQRVSDFLHFLLRRFRREGTPHDKSGSSKGSYDTEDINSMYNPALQKSFSPQFAMPSSRRQAAGFSGKVSFTKFHKHHTMNYVCQREDDNDTQDSDEWFIHVTFSRCRDDPFESLEFPPIEIEGTKRGVRARQIFSRTAQLPMDQDIYTSHLLRTSFASYPVEGDGPYLGRGVMSHLEPFAIAGSCGSSPVDIGSGKRALRLDALDSFKYWLFRKEVGLERMFTRSSHDIQNTSGALPLDVPVTEGFFYPTMMGGQPTVENWPNCVQVHK
ncbi:hypothetical protein BKA83DRAFT_21064 [Pisolithus microcarpus]|nr:hypothetical protein BKA83DRAFT_21064 [Pisolithus microcarpus]